MIVIKRKSIVHTTQKKICIILSSVFQVKKFQGIEVKIKPSISSYSKPCQGVEEIGNLDIYNLAVTVTK